MMRERPQYYCCPLPVTGLMVCSTLNWPMQYRNLAVNTHRAVIQYWPGPGVIFAAFAQGFGGNFTKKEKPGESVMYLWWIILVCEESHLTTEPEKRTGPVGYRKNIKK